jgi:predicted DNA-binding WGR domain protein
MTILRAMSDTSASFHVMRCEPARNMARYYSLTMQPTLFGEVSLIRNWGRIGTRGQQKIDTFSGTSQFDEAYEKLTQRKLRKGYR